MRLSRGTHPGGTSGEHRGASDDPHSEHTEREPHDPGLPPLDQEDINRRMPPRQGPNDPTHDQCERHENADHEVRCTPGDHPGANNSERWLGAGSD